MNQLAIAAAIDELSVNRRRHDRWQRAFDAVAAVVLLLLTAPLWIWAVLLWAVGRIEWTRGPRLGQRGELFHQFTWTLRHKPGSLCPWIGRLPLLVNVLTGRMAIVGPRAVAPGDPLLDKAESAWRFSARPGLVCLWWIRQRANIDYGQEVDADYEYVATRGLRRDLGIVLRAAAAWAFGRSQRPMEDEIELLGLRIDNVTMQAALDGIMRLAQGDRPAQICFLNADCVNIAWRNAEYRQTLLEAHTTLADGVGLKLAGKLLGREIRQNVNGTDMFPRLCETLSGSSLSIYLLGARPGVAAAAAEWIGRNFPRVQVAGYQHGYFTQEEEPTVIRRIADSGASVLLVAFGAPRQELWIREHLAATGARVAMGVGGLFDFYSGRIPRAPLWMRELCLEWLHRVCVEPRRLWKRYLLGNIVFLCRAMGQRLWGPPAWAAEPRRRDSEVPELIVPRRRAAP